MKRLAVLLAAAAFPAAGADPAQEAWKPFEVRLEARAMHEECLTVEAGDKRRYHWKAEGPVDFNIHYHRQAEAIYPVKRDGMRGDGGTFVPKAREDYCWMWTARDKAVKLEGAIELK